MKFKIQRKTKKPIGHTQTELDTARKFSQKLYKEFGEFIRAIVLFGGAGKKNNRDIDILVILDDVRVKFTQDLVETYRIILEKTVADVAPKKLHIQSMKFTSFWEYIRVGDPVATNLLRYGTALIDTGFFDPLQTLLDQGRIRPSQESIQTYFVLAPADIGRAKQHLLGATVDLYWAVINSAHAALMKYGEVPPTPSHAADLLQKTLVKKRILSQKSAKTMQTMYKTFKGITDRTTKEITGKQYDQYKKDAEAFVKEIKRYLEKK
ncbi:MAG: hypothetical protein V1914_00105 [archaeon]